MDYPEEAELGESYLECVFWDMFIYIWFDEHKKYQSWVPHLFV